MRRLERHSGNFLMSHNMIRNSVPLAETLTSVDSLLNDFNRELSAYLEDMVFDEGELYETDRTQTGSDQWAESKIWTYALRIDPRISETSG